MHEENTVSLKVYLMEGKNITEIRRFEVDHGVVTNYDYIRERLQMAMAKLRDQPFKLLWQDSDGDEVTISSDEELMIAFSEFKSNVCKFIVRIPAEIPESEPHISITIPNLHEMFTSTSSLANACPLFAELEADQNCHSCQQPITGARYKCLECVQYYQCNECEYKNIHPDHVMLRVCKNPSAASLVPKCMQILKSHFIRGVRCPGMGSFREKMSHCYKKEEEKEKDKRGHHHRRFRRHGHFSGDNKNSSQNDEPMGECPFNPLGLNNLGDIVGAFLGMYKDGKNEKQTDNAQASSAPKEPTPPNATVIPSGPPMPSSAEDAKMDEDENPCTSGADSQKDAKIKMALELLSEMGFNDENKWLSRLLQHFDGDIAKTIDHLTLGK